MSDEGQPLAPVAPSPRARLAAVALEAALSVEGAVAGHAGPLGVYVTPGPGGPLTGVVAAARPDGRFDLEIHLVAQPVALQGLARRVRALVAERAISAGLDPMLGAIDVGIEDVVARIPLEYGAGRG